MGKKIYDWALANYDNGGHWIVETMSIIEIEAQFASLSLAQIYCKTLQNRQEELKSEGY